MVPLTLMISSIGIFASAQYYPQFQVDSTASVKRNSANSESGSSKSFLNQSPTVPNNVLNKSAICRHGPPGTGTATVPAAIVLTLHFERSFQGLIYSDGWFEDLNCRYVDGRVLPSQFFNITIPLDRCGSEVLEDGTRRNTIVVQRDARILDVRGHSLPCFDFTIPLNRCGSEVLKDGTRRNTIAVKTDARILEIGDNKYILTCNPDRLELDEAEGRQFTVTLGNIAVDGSLKDAEVVSNPGPAAFQLDYNVAIQLGTGPFGLPVNRALSIGEPISYVITLPNLESRQVRVGRCWATDGVSEIQLSDDNGCTLQHQGSQVWSNFETSAAANSKIIYNNIKTWSFPTSSRVNILCNLHVCRPGSTLPACQIPADACSAGLDLGVDGAAVQTDIQGENSVGSNLGTGTAKFRRDLGAADRRSNFRTLGEFSSREMPLGEAAYAGNEDDDVDEVLKVTGGFQVVTYNQRAKETGGSASLTYGGSSKGFMPDLSPPEIVTGQQSALADVTSDQFKTGDPSNSICMNHSLFAAGLAFMILVIGLAIVAIAILARRIRRFRGKMIDSGLMDSNSPVNSVSGGSGRLYETVFSGSSRSNALRDETHGKAPTMSPRSSDDGDVTSLDVPLGPHFARITSEVNYRPTAGKSKR